MDVTQLVDRVASTASRRERVRHLSVVPAREATYAPWPEWVHPEVRAALTRRGISELYAHQVAAAEAAHARTHVAIATGTASGKSVAYLVPALTEILSARNARGVRGASVLYLSPTKALAADQCGAVQALGTDVRAVTVDADATSEQRDWARAFGEYLLTNPDLLHHSLLPQHDRWSSFLGSLRYVVIDEAHHYRGVFGAHVAQVIRRLKRICAAYGAFPTFVVASATMAEPARTARQLCDEAFTAVTEDASPHGQLGVVLWEPPFASFSGEHGAPVRRSVSWEAADLLTDLVVEGVSTLTFVRSRRGVELVAQAAGDNLAEVDPALAGRVAAYRGGYLPEERRELEGLLKDGTLLGVAATNALELGIDVPGLDAVIVAGFPGTRAALWQQWGRAGRAGEDALGVFIARDDPLDTYLVAHPEALLGEPLEATVFDPDNKYVLAPHLCAAAAEIPLTVNDIETFGPQAQAVVDSLTEVGALRRRPQGWFWTDRRRASDLADLRSSGGGTVQLMEEGSGRIIGTIDAGRAHSQAHPGAVYLHRGETWVVEELDLDGHVATMTRDTPAYSTHAREVTEISIVTESSFRLLSGHRVSHGFVDVSHQVVAFLRKRLGSGEVMGEEPLDLPVRTLTTQAVWWTLTRGALETAGFEERELPGAAHAAEHCAIGLLPLFATCDRWDIGGVSTAWHPDTNELTVFVYDGHPGGAGFAERGFERAPEWLAATRDTIAACECEAGCPSCVQSPKCGNGNQPLDKAGALRMLGVLLGTDAP